MRMLLCLVLAAATAGCASMDHSDYVEVPIEQLVSHPFLYDGKRVRVTGGYLVVGPPWVSLSHTTDRLCGGDTAGYLTTTLPWSVFGAPPGEDLPHYGQVAVVEGLFEDSHRPGGNSEFAYLWPAERTVGPLRRARVVSYGEQRCFDTREQRDRANE